MVVVGVMVHRGWVYIVMVVVGVMVHRGWVYIAMVVVYRGDGS